MLFTSRGAAELVNVRTAVIRYWVAEGWLMPAKTLGGVNLYAASDIQDARRIAKARRHAANIRGGQAHRRLDS